jgi:integrase
MNGLEKIQKTGSYRFRRGIPTHLRSFFPDRGTVWREHLDTKDEAAARVRCFEVAAKVERLFQQAQAQFEAIRESQEPGPSNLSIEFLTRLVADWKRAEGSRRAQFVLVRPVMPGWAEFLQECALTGVCGLKPKAETPDEFMTRLEGEQKHIDGLIVEITQSRGFLVGADHPAHAILCNLVRRAWVEVLEAEHRWRTHDYSDLPVGDPGPAPAAASPSRMPNSSPAPVGQIATATNDMGPLFSAAFQDWIRLGKPAPRTLLEARTALRLFKELHGDLPIGEIGKEHTRAFRDALAKLPKNLSAEQKAKPMPTLLASNLVGERRAPQTVNKTLNLLSGVLSRAEKEGHFDHRLWKNPFGVPLAVADDDEDSYEPFSASEIRAIFESPVFAAGSRPKQGRGDTAYWAPLMALFHGARRGEVFQLLVRDVRQEPESGVWFVDVNRDDGKTVKNTDSVRRFPLHPTLIRLGFLEYVECRRKAVGADQSLWFGFEDREKLYGRINRWAKWFSAYLAEHVVDEPTKKFHSFRGTFKRIGKDCDVAETVLDRICGHAIASVGGRYGRKKTDSGTRDAGYSLDKLNREIAKVTFDGEEGLPSLK